MLWPSTPTPMAIGESGRVFNFSTIMAVAPNEGLTPSRLTVADYNARMNDRMNSSAILDICATGVARDPESPSEQAARSGQFGQQVLCAAFSWPGEEEASHLRVKNTFIDGYDEDSDDQGEASVAIHNLGVKSEPASMFRGGTFEPVRPPLPRAQSDQPPDQTFATVSNQTTQPTMLPFFQTTTQPTMMMGQPTMMMQVVGGQPMACQPWSGNGQPMMLQGQPVVYMTAPVGMQQGMTMMSMPAAGSPALVTAAPQAIQLPSSPAGGQSNVEPYATRKPVWSAGSVTHGSGNCRPCAWFWKDQGCENGKDCRHCHLCPEGELKHRKKDKVATLRTTAPRDARR